MRGRSPEVRGALSGGGTEGKRDFAGLQEPNHLCRPFSLSRSEVKSTTTTSLFFLAAGLGDLPLAMNGRNKYWIKSSLL